jgi:outer membrane protein TolC
MEIPDEMELVLPDGEFTFSTNNRARPEYGLLSREQMKMQALSDMANIRDIPKFSGFGQAGVGRPALDMLNNEFDTYYIVGVQMNWNFWNWHKTKRERQILDLNRDMLEHRKEAIDQSVSVEMVRTLADFNRFSELIEHDEEIVEMRDEIVKVYESQLNNGVISSTEYLAELNAASEARLNLKIHEIQMIQAGVEYLTSIGEIE